MNIEYLDLPNIPDELIVDIYQTIRNTSAEERHSEPKATDAEKHAAWNSIKASAKLKEFVSGLFNFKHDVHIFVLSGDLPTHKDNMRDVAYNYILETGDSNTNFHNEDKELVEENKIIPFKWHKLDVSKYHSVIIPKPPRILISVSEYWNDNEKKT